MRVVRCNSSAPLASFLALVISWIGIGFYWSKMAYGIGAAREISTELFAQLVPYLDKAKLVLHGLSIAMAVVTLLMALVGLTATRRCHGCFAPAYGSSAISCLDSRQLSAAATVDRTSQHGTFLKTHSINLLPGGNAYLFREIGSGHPTILATTGSSGCSSNSGSYRYGSVLNNWCHRFGGSWSCAVFMVLNYLLTLLWLGIFAFTVALTAGYLAFKPLCLPQAGLADKMCFNFSTFSLLMAKGNPKAAVELVLCGYPIDQFCKLTRVMLPWYVGAFVGCILIVLGLNHFNACLSANFAHNNRARLHRKRITDAGINSSTTLATPQISTGATNSPRYIGQEPDHLLLTTYGKRGNGRKTLNILTVPDAPPKYKSDRTPSVCTADSFRSNGETNTESARSEKSPMAKVALKPPKAAREQTDCDHDGYKAT